MGRVKEGKGDASPPEGATKPAGLQPDDQAGTPAVGVDQVVIWTLRALLHATKETNRAAQVLARCDDAMRLAGLEPVGMREAMRPATLRAVERALADATSAPPLRDDPIFRNVERLGVLLDLRKVERELLVFAVKSLGVSGMIEPFGVLLPTTRTRLCRALQAVLQDFDAKTISTALERGGTLAATGLVRWASSGRMMGEGPIVPMEGLDSILGADYPDDKALLAPFFRVTSTSELTVADYPHLADDVDLLCRFVSRARRDRRRA